MSTGISILCNKCLGYMTLGFFGDPFYLGYKRGDLEHLKKVEMFITRHAGCTGDGYPDLRVGVTDPDIYDLPDAVCEDDAEWMEFCVGCAVKILTDTHDEIPKGTHGLVETVSPAHVGVRFPSLDFKVYRKEDVFLLPGDDHEC